MKKLISFVVAVLMLLSIAVPVTFATDTTASGTETKTVGSVEADYISKMGYADPESGWIAIDSYDDFALMANGGNFYLTQNVDFTGTNYAVVVSLNEDNTTPVTVTLDGCGFSIENLDLDGGTTSHATIWDIWNNSTLTVKNLTIGSATRHATSNGVAGTSMFARVHSGDCTVDNVCIWADVTSDGNVGGFVAYSGRNRNVVIQNSEMNGSVELSGTTTNCNVAGIAAATRSWVTIENCVNNADVTANAAGSWAGGIMSPYNYNNRCSAISCINNGDIVYVGGADAITGGKYTSAWLQLEGNANTGMVTKVVDNDKNIITVPTGIDAPKAFIQTTNGTETQNVRFILAMSEAEYEANKDNLTFKVTFKVDGQYLSMDFNVIAVLTTVDCTDMTYNAADGVVLCGVIVEDVPTDAWSACRLSYGDNAWTCTK